MKYLDSDPWAEDWEESLYDQPEVKAQVEKVKYIEPIEINYEISGADLENYIEWISNVA